MKKILFALIALTAMASASAQEIRIYRNNRLIETYTNTPQDHYTVKFTDVGNLDKINGHEYVVIAGLKWATMNVGGNNRCREHGNRVRRLLRMGRGCYLL